MNLLKRYVASRFIAEQLVQPRFRSVDGMHFYEVWYLPRSPIIYSIEKRGMVGHQTLNPDYNLRALKRSDMKSQFRTDKYLFESACGILNIKVGSYPIWGDDGHYAFESEENARLAISLLCNYHYEKFLKDLALEKISRLFP